MAAAASDNDVVDISKLTGDFDLNCTINFNLLNLGRYIVNSFETTFNFCCELQLISRSRTCDRCRCELKLSIDRRHSDNQTPVVFRCTNNHCRKQYFSICSGSLFDGSALSLQQLLVFVNLFCANTTSYEQIQYQSQLSDTRLSSGDSPGALL